MYAILGVFPSNRTFDPVKMLFSFNPLLMYRPGLYIKRCIKIIVHGLGKAITPPPPFFVL